MAIIQLTQGQVTVVDDELFEELNQYKWYAVWKPRMQGYYAVRGYRLNGEQRAVRLHRYIAELKLGRELAHKEYIDHINHDTLDNRWENLRVVTCQQNNMNQRPQRNGTCEYKGVSWFSKLKKWRAKIQFNNESIHIGLFTDEIEAAKAYDEKARELFGEFAYLNFPDMG